MSDDPAGAAVGSSPNLEPAHEPTIWDPEVEHLDEALKKLERENPRQARVVELRYFGGLSVEQIGALLEIAPRSVKRDWALARIWLFRELRPGAKNPEAEEE